MSATPVWRVVRARAVAESWRLRRLAIVGLAPVTTIDDWLPLAACRGCDPGLFHGDPGEAAEVCALEVCAGCPVMAECRLDAFAVERLLPLQYVDGVRGGLTASRRRAMLRNDPLRPARALQATCGTESGYYRHRAVAEPACEACTTAHANRARARDARRRAVTEPLVAHGIDRHSRTWLADDPGNSSLVDLYADALVEVTV